MKSNFIIYALLSSSIMNLAITIPLDYAKSVVSIPYVLSFNPERFDK